MIYLVVHRLLVILLEKVEKAEVWELRDGEGYVFVHDDLLGDLADSKTHTLVVVRVV